MSYKHLSIQERELTAIYRAKNWSICKMLHSWKETNPPLPANSNATTKIICRAKLKRVIDVAARNVVRTKSLTSPTSPEQKRSTGNRGKIPISNELSARPLEANERSRFGDWEVEAALIKLLRFQPLKSITSDCGREFQLHGNVTKELGVEFYFAPPHQPWQRGTNENTNGLEYFPKGRMIHPVSYAAAVDIHVGRQRDTTLIPQSKKHPRTSGAFFVCIR